MVNRPYTLADIRPGQHIGWFYTNAESYQRGLTAFVRDGLVQNHKVLCIFEDDALDAASADVIAWLKAEGIDPEPYIERGALWFAANNAIYLDRDHTFSPQTMLATLRNAIAGALDEGFTALRVSGDMAWALHGFPGSESLAVYESQLNTFIAQSACIALCRYDLRRFSATQLKNLFLTHPFVLVKQTVLRNIYYTPDADPTVNGALLYAWMENLIRQTELQEELHRTETHYRHIVENANVGIWQMDAEFRTTHINPVVTEMLGYTEAELLGRPVSEFIHPDDLEDHRQRTTQRRLGYNDRYERRLIRKDGSACYTEVSASALQDDAGNFSGSFAMFMDVSTLHRSVKELALLNQAGQAFNSSLDLNEVLSSVLNETRRLLDVTATSIWLYDSGTSSLTCRAATGPQSEKLRGWRIPAGEGIAGHAAATAESQIVVDVWDDPRHYYPVSTSTQVPIRALLSVPVAGKQGVLGVIEAVDVQPDRFTAADQRLLESLAATAALAIENARLYAQAQQEAQLKSQLLREINHRVANTLNIIQSLIEFELVHAPAEDTAAYARVGNAMRQRVQGFAEIHKLLASLTQWGPLPVATLVKMLSDGVMRSLSQARVAIETHCADAMISPRQASYLALILNELLTNALKYALPTRGALHVEIEAIEDAQQLHIRYRDDGPGYPEEILLGTRADVGLHLVRTFVEDQLEGSLCLSNTPGATVDLRFPIQE